MFVFGGPPTLGRQRSAGSSLSLIVLALAAASGLYKLAKVDPTGGAGAGPLRGVPIRPASSAGSVPLHQTPVRSGLPSAVRGTGPSGFQPSSRSEERRVGKECRGRRVWHRDKQNAC